MITILKDRIDYPKYKQSRMRRRNEIDIIESMR